MLMPERQYKTSAPPTSTDWSAGSVASEINSERELHVSAECQWSRSPTRSSDRSATDSRRKDMPVECVQQLGFQLERNRLANPEIPNDAEIFILVAPCSGIGVISRKVAEPERLIAGSPGVRIGEGCPIKLTIAEGIEISARSRGREDDLTGHTVETNTLIPARDACCAAEGGRDAALIPLNAANLPASEIQQPQPRF